MVHDRDGSRVSGQMPGAWSGRDGRVSCGGDDGGPPFGSYKGHLRALLQGIAHKADLLDGWDEDGAGRGTDPAC